MRLSTVLKKAGLHVESMYEESDAELGIKGQYVIEVYEVIDGETDYSEPVMRLTRESDGSYRVCSCWSNETVNVEDAEELQDILNATDEWHKYRVTK